MKRWLVWIALVAVASGCTTSPRETTPVPITASGDEKNAAVVRRPLPSTTPAAPATIAPNAVAPTAPSAAPIVVPPDVQYVCVTNVGGERRQVAIQFDAKVRELCLRHPEMGPCQYERNVCRNSGGRVYAANGVEITMVTEAEYDKKVMRVRFRAN